MYHVKVLFSVRTELFAENEHFFKGLEYQAQASDDGFTRVIVTDRPEYPGCERRYDHGFRGYVRRQYDSANF